MDVFLKLEITYILFYIITFLWIGEFLFFPSKYKSKDYSEKNSFIKILITIIATILLTIIFTYFGLFQIRGIFGSVLHYIGITLYIIGICFRYVSTIYLGKYFTREVNINKDQELISNGPYKFLRHPLYLGLFLLTIAVPIFFQNIVTIVFSIIFMSLAIKNRMVLEETNMEKILGEKYIDWKNKRYRFIPFIY